jgi:methylmalonyl-CoA/ethylmalonyl-CoA epimerase
MEDAIGEFQALGYDVRQEIIHDPVRRIDICFMANQGILIELITPSIDCELFTKLQKRIGNAPYHFCYIAEGEFEENLGALERDGYFLVQKPEPAIALDGKRVAFLMSETIGLIEILED